MEQLQTDYSDLLYEKVANDLATMIDSGTFRPGERIPSVRETARQRQVSVTTVVQAYQMLEDRGLIEARPQSGYYVRHRLETGLPDLDPEDTTCVPADVTVDRLAMMVLRDSVNTELVQFGAAIPDPALLPTARLNRILASIARRDDIPQNVCGIPEGRVELRVQVAQRSLTFGCKLSPDDLIITAGCTEAVSISLRAIAKPGDMVAVETPTYFGILQALESQGLRALEIPTHPRTGISLEALRFAIEQQPVRACLFSPTFNNPMGSCMPVENKKALVEMLAEYEIPLIEDDVHGELYFGNDRPVACKAFDRNGLVLLCSSFSKDLSPSYRIGWLAPGRYKKDVERIKMATNVGTSILPQLAIAQFLDIGGYDHHLRRIRQAYLKKVAGMSQDILRFFPEGTHVSSPEGGYVLWVKLPDFVDSLDLYRKALKAGITLVPGHIFAAVPRFRNYIRLNAAYYSEDTVWALRRIAELIEA